MLHASTRKLIDRLAEMTELNKLDWSDGENGHINYATEGYSVSLTEGPNEVIITSKDGKELERANAEELAGTQNEDGVAYTAIVAAMTKEAARIARGTETAISTLLAGMQDASAVEEEPPIEEDAADLQEDPVDETTVVAAETIETVAPKPEPVELEDTTETDAEPADEETSELVAAPFVSAETETTDIGETTEFEHSGIETVEAAPDFEQASDAESETEVTEAVVRLADEVKQREDSGIDAAAASAVGAVALAAGLTATQSEPESTEEAETETEVHDEDIAAAAVIATEEPEAATETPQYVPFGLNSDETPTPAPEPEPMVAATETETSTESTSDTVVPFATFSSVTPSFETPSEPTPEPETSPEPVIESALSAAALDTFVEPEPDASVSIEDMQVPTEPSLEPELETTTGLSFDSAPAAAEAPLTFSEDVTAVAAESVSETQPAPEPEIAPLAPETPPASVDEVETAPVSPNQEAQSYSLSGIGAGFGLGALSAKTEASGIPGTSSGPGGSSEKVVIDATDDVLPKPEGNFNLPAGMSPVDPNNPSPEPQASDENDDAESDILKPRTRFNPWD